MYSNDSLWHLWDSGTPAAVNMEMTMPHAMGARVFRHRALHAPFLFFFVMALIGQGQITAAIRISQKCLKI